MDLIIYDSFDKYGRFTLTSTEVEELCREYGLDAVIDCLEQYIDQNYFHFPYKRMFLTHYNKMFEKLCETELSLVEPVKSLPKDIGASFKTALFLPLTYDGSYQIYDNGSQEIYDEVDTITDWFQEEVRMDAHRGSISPHEVWTTKGPKRRQILTAALLSGSDITTKSLREIIWENVPECTLFKPSLARTIMLKLNGTRILDFSAGWGDRLIAALSLPDLEKYVGVDPNKALSKGHNEILEKFDGVEVAEIIYAPFETAELPKETYNLIFTSPPFFDLEKYAVNDKGQSITSYPKYEDWLRRFLFVSLAKAWKVLDVGGHLAIHIADTPHSPYCCEIMQMWITVNLPGAYWKGCLFSASFGDKQKVRPTWVWRKDAKDHASFVSRVKHEMGKHTLFNR